MLEYANFDVTSDIWIFDHGHFSQNPQKYIFLYQNDPKMWLFLFFGSKNGNFYGLVLKVHKYVTYVL